MSKGPSGPDWVELPTTTREDICQVISDVVVYDNVPPIPEVPNVCDAQDAIDALAEQGHITGV